jgi:hypothetical protein
LEHWYVTVRKGEVTVSHKNTRADAVCKLDKELFADIASALVVKSSAADFSTDQIDHDVELAKLLGADKYVMASTQPITETQSSLAREKAQAHDLDFLVVDAKDLSLAV